MSSVAQRANAWIVGDDTGLSSTAIWAHMMGVESPKRGEWSHPHDPADLGRCLRLLSLIPEWQIRMTEMGIRSSVWAALTAVWPELSALMDDEVGIDWSKGHRAERTYNRMREIIDAARRRTGHAEGGGHG